MNEAPKRRGRPPNGTPTPGVPPKRWRTVEDAKRESPDTAYHASEDVAEQARLEGVKDGLEVLRLIRKGALSSARMAYRRWTAGGLGTPIVSRGKAGN